MKKLIALLLILCTVAGLVACGSKPADPNNPSNPSNPSTPQIDVNPENSPYKGKSLQVYGMGTGAEYTDYDQFGKGNYIWMMRAALDEWATINGATIEYMGGYNQNVVLSAINSGNKPDIIFQTGNFPKMSNIGVTSPFTAEELQKLT